MHGFLSGGRRERGNILFLILLAVVLFAALSYAITQSTRGDGKNASGEKNELVASQIMQQAQMMEAAVTRLKLTKDCKDTEISFENPTVSGYMNNLTPGDGRCKVFDPNGGGLSWVSPPNGANETAGALWQYAALPVAGVGAFQETASTRCILQTSVVQATCRDLVMMLGNVTPAACAIINTKVNMGGTAYDNVSNLTMNGLIKFTGDYTTGSDDIGTTTALAYTKPEGCFSQVNNGDIGKWFYYKVLIAR